MEVKQALLEFEKISDSVIKRRHCYATSKYQRRREWLTKFSFSKINRHQNLPGFMSAAGPKQVD